MSYFGSPEPYFELSAHRQMRSIIAICDYWLCEQSVFFFFLSNRPSSKADGLSRRFTRRLTSRTMNLENCTDGSCRLTSRVFSSDGLTSPPREIRDRDSPQVKIPLDRTTRTRFLRTRTYARKKNTNVSHHPPHFFFLFNGVVIASTVARCRRRSMKVKEMK